MSVLEKIVRLGDVFRAKYLQFQYNIAEDLLHTQTHNVGISYIFHQSHDTRLS